MNQRCVGIMTTHHKTYKLQSFNQANVCFFSHDEVSFNGPTSGVMATKATLRRQDS